MKIIEGVDISNLLKARTVFERFRKNLDTDQEQAGAIKEENALSILRILPDFSKSLKEFLDNLGVK